MEHDTEGMLSQAGMLATTGGSTTRHQAGVCESLRDTSSASLSRSDVPVPYLDRDEDRLLRSTRQHNRTATRRPDDHVVVGIAPEIKAPRLVRANVGAGHESMYGRCFAVCHSC